ncbi:MAG: DUF4870 domain-containing protein [Anaerolineae bacterium]|nr:DUF4870 domain-containing protein [Anaerolineae bacterium]
MVEHSKPKRDAHAIRDEQDIVDLDALVRDYTDENVLLHHAERFEDDRAAPPKRKNDAQTWREQLENFLRTPYDQSYVSERVDSSSSERVWAAMAHLSLLIGVPLGVSSAGILGVCIALLPLAIYFAHRARAPFAAKHAMQAALALLISTVGWFGLVVASGILGVILTILLTATLVGILALPFLWLGLLVLWLMLLVLPFGSFFLSVVGAVQALRGRTFSYPYIGKWAR